MKMKNKQRKKVLQIIPVLGLAAAIAQVNTAHALQTEAAGGVIEFNNIVRYNLGVRMEDQDSAIATNPSTDEGTSSYDKHDIVTNRVDWYTELGYDYQGLLGVRLSGAGWYDAAFNSKVKTGPGLEDRASYDNLEFSNFTERYHEGPSGELLEAYVYGNYSIGNAVGDVKIGRQTNLWGEAMIFSPHSVSYSQAPIDGLKASVAPGADAREISMPVGQVHASLLPTANLSLAAQYFFEWEPTRLPEGGTYHAGTDFILEGPDFWWATPDLRLINRGLNEPSNSGDWGVSATYTNWGLGTAGTRFGVYYREFTERAPFLNIDFANAQYEALYPEDAKLFGVSVATQLAGASVGLELVHRKDTALASSILDGSGNVARGDTYHALVNIYKNYGPSDWFSSASLIVEAAFSHLDKVTENESYFNGCSGDRDVDYGCATRNVSQATIRFNPKWTAIAVGWDAGFNTAFTYGLYGNSAVSGGGNEGAGSYSFGPSLTYNANHEFSLSYVDYLATKKDNPDGGILYSNGSQKQDRGWLSLTYKGQF